MAVEEEETALAAVLTAYIIASLTLIKLGLKSGPFEDFGPNLN